MFLIFLPFGKKGRPRKGIAPGCTRSRLRARGSRRPADFTIAEPVRDSDVDLQNTVPRSARRLCCSLDCGYAHPREGTLRWVFRVVHIRVQATSQYGRRPKCRRRVRGRNQTRSPRGQPMLLIHSARASPFRSNTQPSALAEGSSTLVSSITSFAIVAQARSA